MNKVAEYEQNAEECRRLASIARSSEECAVLLRMAETWTLLAGDRRHLVANHPELDDSSSTKSNG